MSEEHDEARGRAMRGEIAYEAIVGRAVQVQDPHGVVRIWEHRRRRRSPAMQFVGVGLLVLALVGHLLTGGGGVEAFRDLSSITTAAVVAAAGVGLAVAGGRRQPAEAELLAVVDPVARTLVVREYAGQRRLVGSEPRDLDGVAEVLFARRSPRISTTSAAQAGEGAGVFVRFHDGAVWPIIPSTARVEEAFAVARTVAEAARVKVKQVGRGWG